MRLVPPVRRAAMFRRTRHPDGPLVFRECHTHQRSDHHVQYLSPGRLPLTPLVG